MASAKTREAQECIDRAEKRLVLIFVLLCCCFQPAKLFFFLVLFCHIIDIHCSLKTSLFKWKPDFDIAANEYQKAGNLSSLFSSIFCLFTVLYAFSYFNTHLNNYFLFIFYFSHCIQSWQGV